MDGVLERILSLIPKKGNGDFVHGAKTKFCKSIGIPNQTLSDWMSGRSTSYKNKLYEIADAYHVSVDWLRTGKTEEEAESRDREELLEEKEMLQIIRDSDLRAEMFMIKRINKSGIDAMKTMIRALAEGDSGNAD